MRGGVDGYERVVRPFLFRLDPETAHHLTLAGLGTIARCPGGERIVRVMARSEDDERLRVRVGDLTFPNPLGLAAGLDKDARAIEAWFALGFGTVEVGTVTPRPQPGNPRPRVWRLPEDEALINALGFPSEGAAVVRQRLVGRRFPGPIGVNLGKNAMTPLELAAEDYVAGLLALWDVADYLVVNVSSPNTPGLRALQEAESLARLLEAVQAANRTVARLHRASPRPVWVKVSLDLDEAILPDLLGVLRAHDVLGLVLGNTSTDPALRAPRYRSLPGGLSGRPLRERAVRLLARAAELAGEEIVLVSVGGIVSVEDVLERLRLGARLVQVCTGLIYRGPAFPAAATRVLLSELGRRGLHSVGQLRGA